MSSVDVPPISPVHLAAPDHEPLADDGTLDELRHAPRVHNGRPFTMLRLAGLLAVLALTAALALSVLTTRQDLREGRSVRSAPVEIE